MSPSRSVRSLSSGDFGDVSSVSRSSSGGLRRSVTRSCYNEQPQNVHPVNVTLTPDADGVRRSSVTPVTTFECSRVSGVADAGMAVSTHTTPEFDQQSIGQRRSSSISTLSSRPDSGGHRSTTSHGRQRSSASLFSEESVDICPVNEQTALSRRTSVASTDRHSTSSSDQAAIFRLPFPKPQRVSKNSCAIESMTTGQAMRSPPQRTSRFDFCYSI